MLQHTGLSGVLATCFQTSPEIIFKGPCEKKIVTVSYFTGWESGAGKRRRLSHTPSPKDSHSNAVPFASLAGGTCWDSGATTPARALVTSLCTCPLSSALSRHWGHNQEPDPCPDWPQTQRQEVHMPRLSCVSLLVTAAMRTGREDSPLKRSNMKNAQKDCREGSYACRPHQGIWTSRARSPRGGVITQHLPDPVSESVQGQTFPPRAASSLTPGEGPKHASS